MNLIGDFLHNIFDGLVLAIVFKTGTQALAWSTFIAVICHEIPSELGDAGVLL